MPTAWRRSCESIGAAPSMRAAAYLVLCRRPPAAARRDGRARPSATSHASLVAHTRKLVQIQRAARAAQLGADQHAPPDRAGAQDAAGLLARPAGGAAAARVAAADAALLRRQSQAAVRTNWRSESMQVFAPLANRLGIWQIKWEIEDLSFRFLQPDDYHAVARLLDERRVERERSVERFRCELAELLNRHGLAAEVQGRPEAPLQHLEEDAGQVARLRPCLRPARGARAGGRGRRLLCRARPGARRATARSTASSTTTSPGRSRTATSRCTRSCSTTTGGRSRCRSAPSTMHAHAEHGVAAHWAYKEAGAKGYGGASSVAAQRCAAGRGTQGGAARAAGLGARLQHRTRPGRRHRRSPAPRSPTRASMSSRRRRR